MLRSFWRKFSEYNGSFGLALILLFGIPRFALVLVANRTQHYGPVSVIFLLMWIAPMVFLTRDGRTSIGIHRPSNYFWLFFSFIGGAVACLLMYLLAAWLYDHTISNWFVYISRSYPVISGLTDSDKQIYFIIFAATGMTFSPIGEELLYRGVIHGSFTSKFGENKAAIFDGLAFAMTHLAHFGIVFISGGWTFLLMPALVWVLLMFGASQLFFLAKIKSGSLLGAIFCHAGFNLAMTWLIFYRIF